MSFFREEEFDLKARNEQLETDVSEIEADENLTPHRPENLGRPSGLPPLKLAELLAQEPDNTQHNEVAVPSSLTPHRPENLGRPSGLPPLKLAELLAQEPENTDSEEINTGPAVGNEVC